MCHFRCLSQNEDKGESVSQSAAGIQMISHQGAQKRWHINGPSQIFKILRTDLIINAEALIRLI